MNITTIILLLLMACGAGTGEVENSSPSLTPQPAGIKTREIPSPDSSCFVGSNLNYENFGHSFVIEYCLACHSENLTGAHRFGAPDDLNFDTAIAIKAWRSRILDMFVVKDPHQRLGRVPSASEKEMVKEWLDCGAP